MVTAGAILHGRVDVAVGDAYRATRAGNQETCSRIERRPLRSDHRKVPHTHQSDGAAYPAWSVPNAAAQRTRFVHLPASRRPARPGPVEHGSFEYVRLGPAPRANPAWMST
jgi:hypothetical protein